MGDLGTVGSVLGGAGQLAAAGASIYGGIQGKNAQEQALRQQQQALSQTGALGSQSTLLGLAQLDLQRQLAARQIDFANQYLAETDPFRAHVLKGLAGPQGPMGYTPEYQAYARAHGVHPDHIWTQQAYEATGAPLRGPVGGGAAFAPFSVTPAERDTLESQFRNARGSLLSSIPARGGELNSQLLNLEMGRAAGVTGLYSDVARRNQAAGLEETNIQRNLAAQIGFNAPGVATPLLASAGAAFNPGSAGAIFGPALAAQGNAAGIFGQNAMAAGQSAAGSGQALGTLAAINKLGSQKNGKSSGGGGSSIGAGKGA